jgi:3-dehydroquinate dehydratase-2
VTDERLLVLLHGVNLNMLGQRPAEHYGTITLGELETLVKEAVAEQGWVCRCYQTNHEGQFVELLHEFRRADALLLNPGAWTHYSYAIRDALEMVECPVAEVHLSDVSSREEWRRHSVISDVVTFTISGEGPAGYIKAVRLLTGAAVVAGDEGEA